MKVISMGTTAMRVVGDKEGKGGKEMATATRVVGKQG
jgi:hypothetical protein